MPAEDVEKYRREVAFYIRRLYKKNLTTTLGGNVSQRSGDIVVITPSGTDKALVKKDNIAVLSISGINSTPGIIPTMEAEMHLSIYRARKDVKAIIHAHPPLSSVFTATDKKIDCTLISESMAVLGEPALTAYAPMGSAGLAAEASRAAANSNVILLKNHGIICLGEDLVTAFNRVEVLESAARMTIIIEMMRAV
jgi:L-fuculose-phosphate aldolase